MSGDNQDSTTPPSGMDDAEQEKRIADLLGNKESWDLMVQRLREGGHVAAAASPAGMVFLPTPRRGGVGSGAWLAVPMQFPFAAPFPPFWGPVQPLPGSASSLGQPGSSSSKGQEVESDDDEDVLEYFDKEEAAEFDPTVTDANTWEAGKVIDTFFSKHFNRSVTSDEREAIMKDFPKPASQVVQVPKLDDDMKRQIKKAGKDPHFGAERSLYRLQHQLLDMVGPLTCLWADMTSKDVEVKPQEIILLIQRVLVLSGSVSHSITQERRKVALSRINPSTVNLLPDEEEGDKKKGTTLFGSGFLERASKRMEEEKALAKVTGSRPPRRKRQRTTQDPNDLRRFLERGAPARYGGRKPQRQQPYSQRPPQHKTQKGKNRKYNQ